MNFFFTKTILLLCVLAAAKVTALSSKNELPKDAFIKNLGQIVDQNYKTNENVLYLFSGKGIKVQLRKNGYSYELFTAFGLPKQTAGKKFPENISELQKTRIDFSRVDIDFSGMNSQYEIIEEEEKAGVMNYFLYGKEFSDVKSFKKITYKNIYPNTDIEFTLTGNSASPLKYNIILRPGADLNKIKFLCRGAASIKKTSDSQLELKLSSGSILENIPESFYKDSPLKKEEFHFELNDNAFSFSGKYDNTRELIIDPSSNIIWGTYFGDASLDNCTSVGVDASNNVFISGYTLSNSNIATAGAYQSSISGSYDMYLAKFTSSGALTWGTYFGGSGVEISYSMFVEPNGAIYICGDASSTSSIATTGAHQTVYGGGIDDAVLAKFNTNGQLIWSTYYGGLQHDIAYVITVDGNGNPIIAGHTESNNTGNCIATPGAFATSFVFGSDVFVAKFNSSGVRQWGTLYGDSGFEEAWGIDCDASNNVVIAGFTESLSGISTPPCHQSSNAGGQDAFVAKFNSTGSNLVWGTYIGGLGNDQGSGVEIDNSGTIFITGNTTSSTGIATPGVYQTSIGSSDDAFVTAFNSSGTQLWGTYFGGEDTDYINDILLDANQNLIFCGQSLSTFSIGSAGAYQPNLAMLNTYDGFFAKFSNGGTKILSSYFGGESNDNVKSIAIDNTGKIYLAGETTSTMGIATPGSLNPNYLTASDGFLAKFCLAPTASLNPAGTVTICMNVNYTLTAPAGFTNYFWNTGATSNSIVMTQPLTPGDYYFTIILTDAFGCNDQSDSTKIVVDNCVTSVENNYAESEVPRLYPIPSKDHLFVELKNTNEGSIHIYSVLGDLVLEHSLTSQKQSLNLEKLVPGIYNTVVRTGGKNYSKKIIKAP